MNEASTPDQGERPGESVRSETVDGQVARDSPSLLLSNLELSPPPGVNVAFERTCWLTDSRKAVQACVALVKD